MDRFKDLDLECDGGGVAKKAALFSGMFKRSFRSTESSVQAKDSLSAEGELSESNDSLTDKEKGGLFPGKFRKTTKAAKEAQPQEAGGMFSGMFKKSPKPFRAKPQSQGDLSAPSELSGSNDNLSDMNELAEVKLNPFRSANKYKTQTSSDDEDPPASSEMSSGDKQSATDAMSKLNLFRSANKRETEEALKENEKHVEEKPKAVKSNMIQQERKERSATPPVPRRPTEEEMKRASTYDKVKPRGTEDNQDFKDMISREKQARPADTPVVPARPSEEELNRAARPGLQKQKSNQAPSDNEGLKEDDSSSKEEKKEEEDKDKTEETNVKKPKRHNPFMPRVKGRVIQRQAQDGAAGNTEENEGGNRSLFDRLEDFRIDPAQPEGGQDVDNLMEWWNSVESWEEAPQDDDMTEKEEAKAFAVTADKVQKGIRVFNKLFSERAESLWQHVIDLNSIADGLDKFSKNTKIAQITGGSTSAIGGVATITGLALAPFTMGASLIVTAVGLGVTTAGGLTSAGAGISSQVNNSMDRKKVEKIVQDYQEKMVHLNKCLTFIKQGIENLKKFNLMKMKKNAFNRDFPALTSSVYEDGAMAGKAIVINAFEIMRVVQIANVAGSTAARAVQIASMATGVLTGLFVGMDIYFVAKDSKELKKGAKSEFAAKIREVTMQLHEGLVELNGIRGELQSTTPENNTGNHTAALDSNKKEKDEKL